MKIGLQTIGSHMPLSLTNVTESSGPAVHADALVGLVTVALQTSGVRPALPTVRSLPAQTTPEYWNTGVNKKYQVITNEHGDISTKKAGKMYSFGDFRRTHLCIGVPTCLLMLCSLQEHSETKYKNNNNRNRKIITGYLRWKSPCSFEIMK